MTETEYEFCHHCEHENAFLLVKENEYKRNCQHCGREIMLCSKCYEKYGKCDWTETKTGGKCFMGETRND